MTLTGAKGYFSDASSSIVIQAGRPQLQTIKTVIHEISHSMLHNSEAMADDKKDHDTKEVEAENTAFMVASMFGLDTSDYSFPYIASWEGKDDLKKLNASMALVKSTANSIFERV